ELRTDVLVQDLQLFARARQERHAFDTHEGLVADLLCGQIVGHRYQTVTHGAQAFGALEAELAAGLDVDLDRAARRLLDLFGESPAIGHVEVAVRPYCRQRQLERHLSTRDGGRHHQRTGSD